MTLFPAFGPDAWALRLAFPWRTEPPGAFPLSEPQRVASATLGSWPTAAQLAFAAGLTADVSSSRSEVERSLSVHIAVV